MRTIAFIAALSSFAPEATAQASGSVSGHVTVVDTRENPYRAAGFAVDAPAGARLTTGFRVNGGNVVPLREAEIRLYVYQSTSIYTVRYARTDASGLYAIDWSEDFTPIKIKVSVIARRPYLTTMSSTTAPPSFQFAISGVAGIVLTSDERTAGFTGDVDVSFEITQASDSINAFLTAREVYAMFSAHGAPVVGGSTRGAMSRVVISTHATVSGGFTPTDSRIFLGPRVATVLPFTVAHEIGHALVWRSLGLTFPLIEPVTDYLCVFPGRPDAFPDWDDFSYECEKAAFHEGLANLNAALWMWRRDSNNRIVPRAPNPWGLEGRGTCASGPDQENRVVCNTRALWDIVDDDEVISNRDLSDVVSVLRSYPDDCPCGVNRNRCANEGYAFDLQCVYIDVDASNWKDFRWNYVALFGQAAEMDGIEAWNGLSAQTED